MVNRYNYNSGLPGGRVLASTRSGGPYLAEAADLKNSVKSVAQC